MKYLISCFLIILTSLSLQAINYRDVGSNAKFCVYTFDGEYYLVLTFEDDGDNHLPDNAIIKFKTTNGNVITLNGLERGSSSNSKSINWGFGITTGSSANKHYAIVPISSEQIEMLKDGVDKVAINTVPEVYSRSKWIGKDSFGQKLYQDFKELKNEFDE